MPVPSDAIGLGRITADQRDVSVWVRRALSAVAWGRCHLVCHWLPAFALATIHGSTLRKGWREKNAYIDAAHRVHARPDEAIRTGKDTGIGRFPSHEFEVNQAWMTAAMTAQILLSWLKLIALDGDLARAEPKTLRYGVLTAVARLVRGGRRRR